MCKTENFMSQRNAKTAINSHYLVKHLSHNRSVMRFNYIRVSMQNVLEMAEITCLNIAYRT